MLLGRSSGEFRSATLAVGIGLLTVSAPGAAQSLDATVSHHARGLFPGEAVLLRVEASRPVTEVRGVVFDETVRFY